jgi:hypothetical protein
MRLTQTSVERFEGFRPEAPQASGLFREHSSIGATKISVQTSCVRHGARLSFMPRTANPIDRAMRSKRIGS